MNSVREIYGIAIETPDQLRSERRLGMLEELAESPEQPSSAEETCQRLMAVLAKNPRDLPFALLYLIDTDGKRAVLSGTAGVAAGSEQAPQEVDPGRGLAPFASAEDGKEPPPLLLPVTVPGRARPAALFVVGSSSRPASDAKYGRFLELVADQIGSALARVRSSEETGDSGLCTEQTVRFSETFVGVLGHELRNPLSAITTAANLLEMRAETDKIKKPVARILSSADRMDHMISQLLDFTRIRLGRGILLNCQRVDLYEVSRAAMDEVAPLHKKAIRLESAGDVVGFWDRERLSQLLATLTGNACQHGSDGSEILIRIDGSSRGTMRIEVRNDGVVPPELLPFLLEPLRQSGDHAEKRDGSSGLGLGLYIAKQIAAAHGGWLGVESTLERGTRFVVELPRCKSLEGAFGGPQGAS